MRCTSLLTFTLASIAYASAFAIPLSDASQASTDVINVHTPKFLSRQYEACNDEVIDELIRRSYISESRGDSDGSGTIHDDAFNSLLKRAPQGDEPNHLGLYEYDKNGKPQWIPQNKPTSTITKTTPDYPPTRPQRQNTQMAHGYLQGAPPPGWQAAPPQVPAGQYVSQPQAGHRRPSMSYGAPATYHQPQAAVPAQMVYGHPGAVAVAAPPPHAGYQAGGVPAASYGHQQAAAASYGHAQQGGRQRRPSTSHGTSHASSSRPVYPAGYMPGPVIPYPPPSQPPPPGAPVIPNYPPQGQSQSKSSKGKGGILGMFKKPKS
ncbi:hypothetical protein K474DRAFT_1713888 [Panus rudis PR-1116 ss-1]|nr:hypothetical protein K474DRAFT_1713888 [Panus rudis PR-1116 ss-1]